MTNSKQRWLYALWLTAIVGFALLHAMHLRADFPNHSPWFSDWAKYTDEGWYANAALRAHLLGHWYLPGDYTSAPALPVWPFLEGLLFFFTGVSVQAARAMAVALFFCNLLLSWLLLRGRGPRWMPLMALTLIVTSPFLYCFSRLAILEPLVVALSLSALNLALRLDRMRRPVLISIFIGVLGALIVLTKTTGAFLFPAVGWGMLLTLWSNRKLLLRCLLAATATCAAAFGLWMALIVHFGFYGDFKYFFFTNHYDKPKEFYWPLVVFWWSLHGGLWIDPILYPLAVLAVLAAVLAAATSARHSPWLRSLLLDPAFRDPAFGASVLALFGYLLFMTYQDYQQPRYFAVVAFFSFFIVAQVAAALLAQPEAWTGRSTLQSAGRPALQIHAPSCWLRQTLGWAVVALIALTTVFNGLQTLHYATHPEYSFVDAAERLTRFIDAHPNGNRLLLSVSGDDISLITRLPSINEEFGTEKLDAKLAHYQPGWFATWNDFDPGSLQAIHTRYSVEQVASFHAFDNPERNVLVLFKLHPLPGNQLRSPKTQNLQIPLPGDKIEIPVE